MAKQWIDAAVRNDKGRVRGNNEDSFFLNGQYMPLQQMDDGAALAESFQDRRQVYAVCDGMGGEAAGEEASFQAVEGLAEIRTIAQEPAEPEQLRQMVGDLSDQIYAVAKEKQRRSGATLAMLWLERERLYLVNVGDSRVYRLREKSLRQLTVDQTEVQRMIALGVLTPEEARKHPKRHVISQYLGMPNEEVRISPEVTGPLAVEPGDRFLLCSDGLTDMVQDVEIERILAGAASPSEAADALCKAALEAGGRDNVTTMTLFARGAKNGKTAGRGLAILGSVLFGTGFLYTLTDFLYRLFR